MPDILKVNTAQWVLSAWTKDLQTPIDRLVATLKARGTGLPSATVRFSPPITLSSIPAPAEIVLSEQPLSEINLPTPVFFENRVYDFEFQFPAGYHQTSEPKIIHWLNSVQADHRHHLRPPLRPVRGADRHSGRSHRG